MSSMKVAIICTHPIQYHIPWFRELTRQDIEVTVYYALLPDSRQQAVGFGEAFAWDIPLLEGYQWELLPNKKKEPNLNTFFGSSTPSIYSRLAATKPDVVILTGWQSLPLLQATWAALRLGIPCLMRGESNGMRQRPLLVRALHRVLFSLMDAFLSIGKLNREFYLQSGVSNKRIFSAPYFVDNQRFTTQFLRDVRDRAALRTQWNIGDRSHKSEEPPICFIFVGKLLRKKRPMDLLKAIEAASRTNRNIQLTIVGTGELMEEARNFVRVGICPSPSQAS